MDTKPRFGLIARQIADMDSGQPYGRQTPYYKQLVEHAALQGWESFVFSPRDVLKQRQTIWAWVRDNGTWRRRFVQPPHVAYIRLPTVSKSQLLILEWLRVDANVQYINQPEVLQMTQDSWRLFQVLQSHPTISRMLPDTLLLRTNRSLTEILEDGTTHVAPRFAHGHKGRAILSQQGEETVLRYEVSGRAHTYGVGSTVALRDKLSELFGEPMLQLFPPMLTFEGCPVLIRSFWQRRRNGQWHEACVMLRLGQPGAQTPQGVTAGQLDKFSQSINTLLRGKFKAVRYSIQNSSRTVAELLSQRSHGAGELSVDAAISTKQSIVIVGVSTWNGIDSIRTLPTPTVAQQALRSTLGYASVLYEQSTASAMTPVQQQIV